MNGVVNILVVLFLLFGIVVADNIKSLDKTSIDIQIEHIKSADPKKRRELMNRFKEQLATMNRKERMEALRRLLGKMHLRKGKNMMNYLMHKQQKHMFNKHPPKGKNGNRNMQSGHHHR